jgi:hypothetical protein
LAPRKASHLRLVASPMLFLAAADILRWRTAGFAASPETAGGREPRVPSWD